MPGNRFGSVQGNHPRRSAFDLSYEHITACDMGQLIPIVSQECVPGDSFSIGQELIARMQPLVAPIMHEIDWTIHTFFVPNRLMMGRNAAKYNIDIPPVGLGEIQEYINVPDDEREFEDFIKGGEDGNEAIPLPLWSQDSVLSSTLRGLGTLWDYFGHQTGISTTSAFVDSIPLAFDKRAYNLIWNEYYRDEELQEFVPLDSEALLYRNWRKDYFTIARPEQQRGVSPSFPLSGFAPLALNVLTGTNIGIWPFGANTVTSGTKATTAAFAALATDAPGALNPKTLLYADQAAAINGAGQTMLGIDLSEGTVGFDMNDLRTAVQIQRFMELNARAGTRYIEFLRAHFGVAPRDSTLQRPEYIGGCGGPVVISEVLQTSATDNVVGSPQANMAGHGITASSGYVGKYFCTEFGWIVSLLSIMPKPVYQQGIKRQSLRRSMYDFFFPEFAHLSEQAVFNAELMVTSNPSRSRGVFGYQPIYEEMRVNKNMITGVMRDGLEHWHVSRIFDASTPPELNEEFISTRGNIRKDIFAFYDSTPEAAGFLIRVGNMIKAIRPLPYFGTPGRLDHVGGV